MPVLQPSIRRDLLKWLIAPLLLINLVGAGFTYWLAWLPAQHAFDQNLMDSTWGLYAQVRHRQEKTSAELTKQAEQILRSNHSDTTFFAVRNIKGEIILGDKGFPSLPDSDVFERPINYDAEMRGEPVRIAALQVRVKNGVISVAVAETVRKRNRAHYTILLSFLALDGVLTFISLTAVLVAVRRGLKPLQALQGNLEQRGHGKLGAIDSAGSPVELLPLIGAMNQLMERISKGEQAQQNFLADVAHQLRTPLTGLKLQLELLHAKHRDEPDTTRSLEMMNSSVERMIRQSRQLLALARSEHGQFEQRNLENLSLDKLVEASIQHFIEEADKKQIDLGFDLRPGRMRGDRFLLSDLIDNLIDNAVRYSPPHSSVTVRCQEQDGETLLTVEDSGPGIAPEHRELIFDRFYRANDKVAGSGLGLAIVREIAREHGAVITLDCGETRQGTVFTVRFPSVA
ncbi:sensor histidine kinase [Herbaspirillum sp. SJZ099]|uniref:sensor histidine kinase n=1 Tax=Herbaspirillum sp. SJZ099 TaxID=2572916 RepID=UPI0011A75B33|nr:sensor histidine kinase [Herbaspirillum sp. SJZ099]TWC67508.1 two-component system sensor histidine kinase TctE [Herbaspirillum sp. SJZ099]